jgi:putative phosphoesterase
MKVGLLSDIHGNAHALTAVLDSARSQGVERLLCAGDLVGYYYEPHKCLDLLGNWDVECIRGNHEEMLFGLIKDPTLAEGIRRKYGSALSMAVERLSSEQLAYLDGLPVSKNIMIEDKSFLIAHGSPWDINRYIYPDSTQDIFNLCAKGGQDYILLGHTHYQLLAKSGNTLIINPGSVGQPRGKNRGSAHWAILDIETGSCAHQSTNYDCSAVIAQVEKHDAEICYLIDILSKIDNKL